MVERRLRKEFLILIVDAQSERPIACAIVEDDEAGRPSPPPVSGFESVIGAGVSADIGGIRVEVGMDRFIAKLDRGTGKMADVSTG